MVVRMMQTWKLQFLNRKYLENKLIPCTFGFPGGDINSWAKRPCAWWTGESLTFARWPGVPRLGVQCIGLRSWLQFQTWNPEESKIRGSLHCGDPLSASEMVGNWLSGSWISGIACFLSYGLRGLEDLTCQCGIHQANVSPNQFGSRDWTPGKTEGLESTLACRAILLGHFRKFKRFQAASRTLDSPKDEFHFASGCSFCMVAASKFRLSRGPMGLWERNDCWEKRHGHLKRIRPCSRIDQLATVCRFQEEMFG